MRLTIESTDELVLHQGSLCRAWLCTHNGRDLLVLVAGLVLDDEHPDPEFEREFLGPFGVPGQETDAGELEREAR